MSKSKNDDLYLMHAIRGIRLTEAIEKSQIRPAELLRRAKAQSKSYFNMSPQTLSQIMHGKRPLRYEDAALFADILGVDGVDTDFLMGGDSPAEKKLSAYEKSAKKYDLLLNQIGARILSYAFENEDKNLESLKGYTIAYDILSDPEACKTYSKMLTVTTEEMESFYQDVCRFIQKRFEIMKDLSAEEV